MEDYKNLPIKVSITDFKNLRISHALYIDKTEYIWNLIQACGDTFFMARPRRFGKTLLLSTLYYLFRGEKKLFDGLAVSKKDYDWKQYPVIHLSFGAFDALNYRTADTLNFYLSDKVNACAWEYGIELEHVTSAVTLFEKLILALSRKYGPVVILIDEYDKPVTELFYSENAEEIIQTMKNFYSVIKDCNPYERFVFVTGVTKIALTTFYSAFNNPQDISMDANYAAMLGYTQDELEKYFGDRMEPIAEKYGITTTELYAEIKRWYNGYRFHRDVQTIYNPVSLGYFFCKSGEFSNYWIDTGTPSVLLNASRKQKFDLIKALEQEYSESVFKSFDLDEISVMGLLLQTGYLTIKGCKLEHLIPRYTIGFPNYEVSSSFNEYLLKIWAKLPKEASALIFDTLKKGILTEDPDLIQTAWEQVFSHFIYDLRNEIERAYQTVFFVFSVIAVPGKTTAEQHTNRGSADTVIETEKAVYIFEFKVDAPIGKHIALKQIYEKDYGSRYRFDGKNVYAIGINFSKKDANIAEYESVRYGEKPWEQEMQKSVTD